MSEIKIDAKVFQRRSKKLITQWKDGHSKPESGFHNIDSILAVMGSADEDNPYQKTAALHTWLLGYEFPATLLLFTLKKLYILTSGNKAKYLEGLGSGSSLPVVLLKRTKDEAHNRSLFDTVLKELDSSGNRVGIFVKDSYKGKFVDEWLAAYGATQKQHEEVDVSAVVSSIMAVKEEEELRNMRTASKASVAVLCNFFVDQMTAIVDEEKKVSHSKLAERCERVLEDEKFLKTLKAGNDFDPDQLEWCYTPIIQSGGDYDLKPSALSNDENIHGGVILCSLGLRYRSYCSNVARTYLINPNDEQLKYYDFLLSLQKKIIDNVKDGMKVKDLYAMAAEFVKSKHPELEQHFLKNIGCGIGIDFRDTSLILNAKNGKTLQEGMTLNVSLGFTDLKNKQAASDKDKIYSLLLVDTVKVGKSESAVIYTDGPKSKSDILYFFKDAVSEDEKKHKKKPVRQAANTAILPKKTRGVGKVVDESAEQKRKEHQKLLLGKLQEAGSKRYPDGSTPTNGVVQAVAKKFESYKRDNQLPSSVSDLNIVLDTRNQSIILPMFGRPVPFHIATVKNVSKNEEGEFTYLRLNFLTPGQVIGKKDDMPFDEPNANFVRSLTFRSADNGRMADLTKQIQEMKKNAVKKEAEKKELADVVDQDSLLEVKNRRPQKLIDVFVRPGLDGKRVSGELEIHQNGIRYQSPVRSDQRIDILFSNIRHLFYQPCDNELMVIIHVHLKSPILIGKKKAKDVQFYREASDVQFDETANRKRKYRYGDEDELEQEQEERKRRSQLNKEFRSFSEKIAEASDGRVDVDIPFRELGFSGVPFRSNVLLQPTTDCIVHLTDTPFLVVTLLEIEVAHLERIQFGLKNFDMVFVFKDFNRVPVHVNTVPMTQLDNVKEWLDSVDIPFTEGPLNLNWGTIMKTVNEDPAEFFREGGWGFLANDSDAENSDESEEESEFEASGIESGPSESDSEGSDFDENASADEGSEMSAEESGEDWSDMENKAANDDRENGREESDKKAKTKTKKR